MLVISCAVLALFCSVSAAPRMKRFDVYDSYGFSPYSFALVRPSSYGAVATGSAVGGSMPPYYMPNPFMFFNPFIIPFPQDIPKMVSWYEGPNVCVTAKEMDEPDEMKEWLSEDFDGSYSHQSSSCRGNNEKHVCFERKSKSDGTSKMQMKKWECCYGFVRTTDGTPGCTESGSEDVKSVTPATSVSQMKMKDQFKYSYYSKDNPKDKSGVENVPIQ